MTLEAAGPYQHFAFSQGPPSYSYLLFNPIMNVLLLPLDLYQAVIIFDNC